MLSKADQAKYPIVSEAVEYVREKGLTIEDLADPIYRKYLDRAESRLREAIEGDFVSNWHDDDEEIISFPVAVYFATVLEDDWVRRRFALAESKRASQFLGEDDTDKVIKIASKTFDWKIDLETETDKGILNLRLGFKDYIRNALRIREPKWKLTNRLLEHGFVRVSKDEAARLLEEEIQSRILSRTREAAPEPPDFLRSRIGGLKKLVSERRPTITSWDLPDSAVSAAMPPCIRNLYNSLHSGKHIPHIGRFALTSFLVNVGASHEDVLRLFKITADFDERKTRYQVEHIAGARGGRTKYKPPKCATLKTHGLCISPDELCGQISHPLSYYRRKLRRILPKGRRHAER